MRTARENFLENLRAAGKIFTKALSCHEKPYNGLFFRLFFQKCLHDVLGVQKATALAASHSGKRANGASRTKGWKTTVQQNKKQYGVVELGPVLARVADWLLPIAKILWRWVPVIFPCIYRLVETLPTGKRHLRPFWTSKYSFVPPHLASYDACHSTHTRLIAACIAL